MQQLINEIDNLKRQIKELQAEIAPIKARIKADDAIYEGFATCMTGVEIRKEQVE